MSTPPVRVAFETLNQITVGTVDDTNTLDGLNVADFGNEVIEYIKDKTAINLLLNFENITYMSSAALTELLRMNEALRNSNGSVRLCNLTTDIRKVFQITNLDQLFGIHDNEDVTTAAQRFERSLTVAADEDAWASQDLGT